MSGPEGVTLASQEPPAPSQACPQSQHQSCHQLWNSQGLIPWYSQRELFPVGQPRPTEPPLGLAQGQQQLSHPLGLHLPLGMSSVGHGKCQCLGDVGSGKAKGHWPLLLPNPNVQGSLAFAGSIAQCQSAIGLCKVQTPGPKSCCQLQNPNPKHSMGC